MADPVNTGTGDYSETSTDASAATFGPLLEFDRTYDSSLAQAQAATATPGPLGYGWTDNWNISLTIDSTSGAVTVTQADGAETTFYPPVAGVCVAPLAGPGTTGSYCAPKYVTATLSYASGSSTYTFVTHPYRSYSFNSTGELTAETTAGGADFHGRVQRARTGGRDCPRPRADATRLPPPLGERSYSHLRIRPHHKRDRSARPKVGLRVPLHRSGSCSTSDLVSVTDPLGNITSYSYDEGTPPALVHDLLTITKPNGQPGGT